MKTAPGRMKQSGEPGSEHGNCDRHGGMDAMDMKLWEPMKLKGLTLRNRVGVPAMVCYEWTGLDGRVTPKSVAHYASLAKGGAGLIVTEALCVDPMARVCDCSMGIWADGQIEGLRQIVEAGHADGAPVIFQLQHSGLVGYGATKPPHNYLPAGKAAYLAQHAEPIQTKGPSAYACVFPFDGMRREAGEMTLEEIRAAQDAFVAACGRAHRAGADGVELHGCHFYLISQFMNRRVNRRQDAYGTDPSRFCVEIVERVKALLPENFVVGVRLGLFEPTLEDGIRNAQALERAGVDYLHLSFGFAIESEPEKPEGYPFNEFIYGAEQVKRRVSVPVFAVNGIETPEQADAILRETGVDLCFVGVGHLVNPSWVNDAKAGRELGKCVRCSFCQWRAVPERCPGRMSLERKRRSEGA